MTDAQRDTAESLLPFVRAIVMRYAGGDESLSIAHLALCRAVDGYSADMGIGIRTHVYRTVRRDLYNAGRTATRRREITNYNFDSLVTR